MCHSQDHSPLSDAVLCHQPAELGGLQGRELLSLLPVRALAGLCRHPHRGTDYSANMGRPHMDQQGRQGRRAVLNSEQASLLAVKNVILFWGLCD